MVILYKLARDIILMMIKKEEGRRDWRCIEKFRRIKDQIDP